MEFNIKVIANNIVAEELPFPYSEIAQKINVETALKLAEIIQGCTYSFPKLDKLIMKKRNEQIVKEFDGYNIKELALKYNLTDRWIRVLVGEIEDDSEYCMDDFL